MNFLDADTISSAYRNRAAREYTTHPLRIYASGNQKSPQIIKSHIKPREGDAVLDGG
jgi:hypothetical protein